MINFDDVDRYDIDNEGYLIESSKGFVVLYENYKELLEAYD